MGTLRATPWVAKLDGGAICEYCSKQYTPGKPMHEQHAKHCPWWQEHKDDPNFTWESAFNQANRMLLQE